MWTARPPFSSPLEAGGTRCLQVGRDALRGWADWLPSLGWEPTLQDTAQKAVPPGAVCDSPPGEDAWNANAWALASFLTLRQ